MISFEKLLDMQFEFQCSTGFEYFPEYGMIAYKPNHQSAPKMFYADGTKVHFPCLGWIDNVTIEVKDNLIIFCDIEDEGYFKTSLREHKEWHAFKLDGTRITPEYGIHTNFDKKELPFPKWISRPAGIPEIPESDLKPAEYDLNLDWVKSGVKIKHVNHNAMSYLSYGDFFYQIPLCRELIEFRIKEIMKFIDKIPKIPKSTLDINNFHYTNSYALILDKLVPHSTRYKNISAKRIHDKLSKLAR